MRSPASWPVSGVSVGETWATANQWAKACRSYVWIMGQATGSIPVKKGQTLVILLCGGDKRTQERDIRQAQQYWGDYQQRER